MRHEKLNHNREAKGKTSKEITRKSYDCEICGAELTSGYILRQHMVTHTGEWRCQQVRHIFNWKNFNLCVKGEKKFKCRFCNSRFSFETNCKRHEARQHLQKGLNTYRIL